MKLNFPESTDLFQIARDLHQIGWIVSARRNRDGSHDVLPRQPPRPAPATSAQPLVSTSDLEGLQP